MRIRIILCVVALISASAVPAMASDISINNGQDEVKFKYEDFSKGDHWSVKLYTDSTKSALRYDFSGEIEDIGKEDDWYIWVSSHGHKGYGVHLCVYAGTYYAVATGTHLDKIHSKTGRITIDPDDVCNPAIPPLPELNPLILTSTGLLGLILISRKYTK